MTPERLELVEVVKHFQSGVALVKAVDGASLTVEPGEVVAIYGPSGSGKSTLLLLAAGLLRPDSGTVRYGASDLSAMSRSTSAAYRRRTVGFVTQRPHLDPGGSALGNASVKLLADGVPRRRARKVAAGWLERVGVLERGGHRPGQLSVGQQQRVAIARALANDPRLVLADEPTGSLDTATGGRVLQLLASLARERAAALVIVTHDPQATQVADTVLHLRDGRLHHGSGEPEAQASTREVPTPR